MSTFTRMQKLKKKAPGYWLGHVFVGILTLPPEDQDVICEELTSKLETRLKPVCAYPLTRAKLADTLYGFLERYSLPERRNLVQEVNAVLQMLLQQDFFGTEGTLDPRGDHRS